MARTLILITALLALVLVLVIGAAYLGVPSEGAAVEPDATAGSRILRVHLQPTAAVPGAPQTLDATLHNPMGELMILTLSITYADGQKQTVVESSLTETGILSWTVPKTASTGLANYRLSAGGCGCGAGDYGLQPPALESTMEGTFAVN